MSVSPKPPLIWTNILLFSLTLLGAVILVPAWGFYHGFGLAEVVGCILLLGYSGISITAGYHRLWSHKTYEAHPVLKVIFAIGGAFALQNSALHWSSDHRVHHRHVDNNEKDPYSAGRGFWYSHIGWMLREYQGDSYDDYRNVRDLTRDKVVMWQHKYYLPLVLATNIGIPVIFGLFSGDVIGAFLMCGLLRLVLSHHFTFFINSLAHIWGKQTYTDKNSARDNGFLAFLTYGEGYHNFHHLFEYDYRNGIRWWQFDPTKWLIKSCSWLGLTSKLKKSPEERIQAARYHMQLQRLQSRLQGRSNTEQLIAKTQAEYEELLAKLNAFYSTRKRLLDLKKRRMLKRYEQSELVTQCRELQQRWLAQHKQWRQLTAQYT
ncbi:acyl-CoA desaturase [Corallincola spongiicola]|uniref:Acyl-CoA desaturase n=1 Tax=Corallincola spongiicola TaxID=2520508 RepID=A0ABY1WPT7_9GAMM|nr:fatty acid desaturase [Corallincola spongiicola]TAA46082.1 acyl-CoA desaturase [Corallincola spongiicola]